MIEKDDDIIAFFFFFGKNDIIADCKDKDQRTSDIGPAPANTRSQYWFQFKLKRVCVCESSSNPNLFRVLKPAIKKKIAYDIE